MIDIDPIDGLVPSRDFIDVLNVRLVDPLSPAELGFLRDHSGSLQQNRQPLCWSPGWRYGLRLFQPDDQAIAFLASIPKVKITYVEIARDWEQAREQVQAWLDYTYGHFIQRWHGQRRYRRWENGHWRSADLVKDKRRVVGTVFQAYNPANKDPGKPDCCHLEAKIYGSSALRRMGIHHPADLVGFDYQTFWNRYLLLVDVDREALGRWWENRRTNSKRRTPIISRHGYNQDRATGNYLCWIYGRDSYSNHSIQLLIDNLAAVLKEQNVALRTGSWLSRFNTQIDNLGSVKTVGAQGLAATNVICSANRLDPWSITSP